MTRKSEPEVMRASLVDAEQLVPTEEAKTDGGSETLDKIFEYLDRHLNCNRIRTDSARSWK